MSRNRMLSIIKKAGIIGIWLVIWQIASSVTGLAFLLPGPVTVFWRLEKPFVRVHFTGSFFTALLKSVPVFWLRCWRDWYWAVLQR